MPTALVTGSKGFIGKHLVQKLTEKGWGITEIDLPFDITKKAAWQLKLPGVNYIFHLAGHLDNYYEGKGPPDFSSYIDINIKSMALMFEVIIEKRLPIKKIIVASSQSVYGEGQYAGGLPIKEHENDVLSPISLYGASKAAMEDIVMTLGRIYKIPVVALRYSIVLGPGQKFKDLDSRIVPAFIEMAKQGEVITHEDGKQLRDFINIHDLIDAHLFLVKDEKANYEIFNVGSGVQTSVMEVAQYIASKFGVQAKAGWKKRINTARNQIMNIDKIKSLGWTPKLTWKDAVDEYIEKADY